MAESEAMSNEKEVDDQWLSWQSESLRPFSDWTVYVKVKSHRRKRSVYHIHRLVLAASPRRSGYFATMFLSNMAESRESCTHIELEDSFSASLFPDVLDFVYSGKIDVQGKIATDEAKFCLLSLADYFDIPTLKNYIIECLIQTFEEDPDKLVSYLEQTEEGRSNYEKEVFNAIIQHCASNLLIILENEVGLLLKPEWIILIFERVKDYHDLCSHEVDELVGRILLSYKGKDINIIEDLLSSIDRTSFSARNGVRFLVFLRRIDWDKFDSAAVYEEFVGSFEDGFVNNEVTVATLLEAQKATEENMRDVGEELEDIDLDSFLSDESSEFEEFGSFQEDCKNTVVRGWETLCEEKDEEMTDLISSLDGKEMFTIAQASRLLQRSNEE